VVADCSTAASVDSAVELDTDAEAALLDEESADVDACP